MRRLILVAALALSACGDSDSDKPRHGAPPDVAANFSQPLDARGADPAWGLKIRGLQFTLERPSQPDLVATAPGATLNPHSASWAAKLPDGQAMTVNLYASGCTDPLTRVVYPFSAEVLLPGSSPLNGCAGKPGAKR